MPDENVRTEFAKQIVTEMTNPDHHLYTTAYDSFCRSLILDMS